MRLRDSVWALLVQEEVGVRDEVVVAVRRAMLDALDELSSPDIQALDDVVSRSLDIAGLWSLRADLKKAIAAEFGIDVAQARINRITEMFGKY